MSSRASPADCRAGWPTCGFPEPADSPEGRTRREWRWRPAASGRKDCSASPRLLLLAHPAGLFAADDGAALKVTPREASSSRGEFVADRSIAAEHRRVDRRQDERESTQRHGHTKLQDGHGDPPGGLSASAKTRQAAMPVASVAWKRRAPPHYGQTSGRTSPMRASPASSARLCQRRCSMPCRKSGAARHPAAWRRRADGAGLGGDTSGAWAAVQSAAGDAAADGLPAQRAAPAQGGGAPRGSSPGRRPYLICARRRGPKRPSVRMGLTRAILPPQASARKPWSASISESGRD